MTVLKKKLKPYLKNTIFGILFTIALGTFLHFTYDISGKSPFVGAFSAVNESVWEHLKLLFIPFFIYTIVSYFTLKNRSENFLLSSAIGVIFGMLFIVIGFYAYTAIVGHSILPVDIALFVLACIFSFLMRNYLIRNNAFDSIFSEYIGMALFIFLLLLFVVFTFYPPDLAMFSNPEEGLKKVFEITITHFV